MTYIKEIAVIITGFGAVALIFSGSKDAGIALLSSVAGLYIGEAVGARKTSEN